MNETEIKNMSWWYELKFVYIREQLELRGIYSQYRLNTTWSHVCWRCAEKFGRTPAHISWDKRKEATEFIKEIVPEFIKDAWGNPGRVHRVYNSSFED